MWRQERVVGQCCAALCNLSFENESLRIKLGDLGACEMFTAVCQRCQPHGPRKSACDLNRAFLIEP